MVSYAADGVAGLSVPDTALARDITEFARRAEDDLLLHHSRRVGLTVPYRSKCDILRDEGEACAVKLTAAGVRCFRRALHSSPRHLAHVGEAL